MSAHQALEAKGRTVGDSEGSWCKAVRGGTGIVVLALLTSKAPDISRLQTALHKLQNSHPILKSRLHSNADRTFSFVISPTPFVKIESYDLSTSSKLLRNDAVSPFQQILEHELNRNTWHDANRQSSDPATTIGTDMFLASVYAMPDKTTWVVVMRLHVSAGDRTTAVSLLRELLVLMTDEKAGSAGTEEGEARNNEEGEKGGGLAIEDLVPAGKVAKKAMWARGLDVLSYSLSSLKLTNLKFIEPKTTRFSRVVRLQLNHSDTERVLAGCKRSGIKLCGALTAAGLMAAQSSQRSSNKYGVVTFSDCRSSLEPPLSPHNFGFYHSAILNCHSIKGGESLWELGKRIYGAFAKSKNSNKHFSDMADMNLLMCKAIDNPGLTSSSSLRTAIMSVFEDTVIDDGGEEMQREVIGLEDYVECTSVHGVGPSIAIFDTIRDGRLDCVCVYPASLHSGEQMQELVNKMKAILVEGGET